MVDDAVAMLVEQTLHGIGVEESTVGRSRRTPFLAREIVEVPGEPIGQRRLAMASRGTGRPTLLYQPAMPHIVARSPRKPLDWGTAGDVDFRTNWCRTTLPSRAERARSTAA